MLRPSSQSERGLRLRRRSPRFAMCGRSCRNGARWIPGPPSVCADERLNYCGQSRPSEGGAGVIIPGTSEGFASAPAERASMTVAFQLPHDYRPAQPPIGESKAADAGTPCAEARGRNLVRPSLLSRQCRSRSRAASTSLYFE